MAWPATPLTTYLSLSTPAIKASDLNAFQSGLNGIIKGTYSLAAVIVDGSGGASSTPRVGTIRVSADDSGTGGGAGNPSLPGQAVAFGEFGRGLVCIGWAVINSSGTVLRHINVRSVAHSAGTGTYVIVFNTSPSDRGNGCAVANITNASDSVIIKTSTQDDGGGRIQVDVFTGAVNPPVTGAAAAFSAADRAFQVLLFAA